MSAAVPTAWWPLDSLVRSLARAGWGTALAGPAEAGLRTVLRGLVDVLDHRTALGETTAPQIADATGLSDRWVRECLARLVELGLVEWHRGGIVSGKPRPSIIKVVKARVVDLIYTARPELAQRLARRADVTAARIRSTLRQLTVMPGKRHKPRSTHAEVRSALHSLEVSGPLQGTRAVPPDDTTDRYGAPLHKMASDSAELPAAIRDQLARFRTRRAV